MAIFKRNFNFLAQARYFFIVSVAAVLVAIGSLIFNGLQFGLDFTSGTLVEAGYSDAVVVADVTRALSENGYDDALVVAFGSDQDVLVRLPVDDSVSEAEMASQLVVLGEDIRNILQSASGLEVSINRLEFVGPRVGEELAESGSMGLLVSMGMIMLYVGLRFQTKFAVAAVIGLFHDVIITAGVFSLFRIDFDLTVLAALLALIGYSINDKIVVFDRIRENFRIMRKGSPVELINTSLNQTLSRTIVTSGTTMLVVVAMLVVGGETIRGFATALTIGIAVGTYSSIYICSKLLLLLKVSKEDLMVPVKEGAADSMP